MTRFTSSSRYYRFNSTLAILEQRDGKLQQSALGVVAAASKLGNPVTAFVTGSKAKEVAEQAAKVEGVSKVIYVNNGAYDRVWDEKNPKNIIWNLLFER